MVGGGGSGWWLDQIDVLLFQGFPTNKGLVVKWKCWNFNSRIIVLGRLKFPIIVIKSINIVLNRVYYHHQIKVLAAAVGKI